MRLIQILLPVTPTLQRSVLEAIQSALTEKYGGVTAYMQTPAHGVWKDPQTANIEEDRVMLIEVMSEAWDAQWWREYRTTLEGKFHQKEIVIRALSIDVP